MHEVEKEIRRHIIQDILRKEDDGSLEFDSPLIRAGIIDSLGIQILVSFLEKKYGLTIPEEEVYPENFDSINEIASLVKKLKASE